MADVRTYSGVPPLTTFGGVASPMPGTPIVVDSATGDLYVVISGDTVVKVAATSSLYGLPRAAAGGTVNAITADFSPDLTLTDQTICAVVSAGANVSTTPTFAPDGLTAHTITTKGGLALVAGDIGPAGFVAILEYNAANTRWELLNPVPTSTTSLALSAITAAVGANTIASGDNAQVWNWALTTAAKSAFKFGETTAATNGVTAQYLVDIGTLATSTAIPFRVNTRGNANDSIRIDKDGTVNITGLTLATGTSCPDINITGGADGASGGAGNIRLTGGAGNGSIGGTVYITGGTSKTNSQVGEVIISGGAGNANNIGGGRLQLLSGNGGTANSPGGAMLVTTGQGFGNQNSGVFTLSSGIPGATGASGALSLSTGVGGGTSGNSGSITLNTGTVTSGTVGSVILQAGGVTKLTVNSSGVTLVTPALGTPASGVLTNCTGTAAGLTAGNVTTNANLTGPVTSVGNATSLSVSTCQATLKIPLYLFTHFASVGNIGTGEDDLYSDTIAAGQLTTNGDKLEVEYGGTFVSSATATRELKIYFGGTLIFDSGALTLSLSAAWTIYTTVVRVSASVIRYMISMTTEGAALAAYTAVGEVTGLTLSNTNVLKITGEAAGVGAATDDIQAKLGSILYRPF